jgi:hypothetical protein
VSLEKIAQNIAQSIFYQNLFTNFTLEKQQKICATFVIKKRPK